MKILFFVVGVFTFLSCSKGITKSRVCALDQGFDPLKGCSENFDSFEGIPETIIYSFIAKDVNRDAKVTMQWYYDDAKNYVLVDSFSYYIKQKEELIVSGIDRNFLQLGTYVVKTKILDGEITYEDEKRFIVLSGNKPAALLLLVGNAIDQNGLVVHPHTYFDINDSRVFVSTYVYDAKPNSEIKIHFNHQDKTKFSRTFSMNTGPNPKSKFLLYANLPNVNLPLGEYQVVIDFGGENFTAPFFIDATQELPVE